MRTLFSLTDSHPFSVSYSPSELKEGSWQVTRVVRPDELGRADEMLKEQMKKLELSSPASETLICAW